MDFADGKSRIMMQLELNSDHGVMLTESGDAVAVMNKRTFEAVSSVSLIGEQQLEVDAWVLLDDWDNKSSERRNLSKNNRRVIKIQADLLLYGPGDNQSRDQLASTLGKYRAFLQDPHDGMSKAPYINPQSLELPFEISNSTVMIGPWSVFDEEVDDGANEETGDQTQGAQGQLTDLIMDFETFLEQLPMRHYQQPIWKDSRIITPLLRYFALHYRYMSGHLSSLQSSAARNRLHDDARDPRFERRWTVGKGISRRWRNLVSPDTMKSAPGFMIDPCSLIFCFISYRHSITGAKNRSPDGFLGGILADDMGVGKTFTTLITILASQNRAAEFADLKGSTAISPSRATIVIVPSECIYPRFETLRLDHF
jgi:hypothetical protein